MSNFFCEFFLTTKLWVLHCCVLPEPLFREYYNSVAKNFLKLVIFIFYLFLTDKWYMHLIKILKIRYNISLWYYFFSQHHIKIPSNWTGLCQIFLYYIKKLLVVSLLWSGGDEWMWIGYRNEYIFCREYPYISNILPF